MTRTKKAALLSLAVGLLSTGCQMNLRHIGYAAPNKVWYHWSDGNGQKHTIVVCDVQADGSESNCKESEI
jgi:hypothetical protein